MTFQVVAVSPEGQRIKIGLGLYQLSHALEDRDELRAAYLRKGAQWTVEVEDSTGRQMDYSDLDASPTAGDEAA